MQLNELRTTFRDPGGLAFETNQLIAFFDLLAGPAANSRELAVLRKDRLGGHHASE
jgi:hypothetical protein